MTTEKIELVYAPTHINPAWPRLSSPRIPTVRLRETARMMYIQMGTSSPVSILLSAPAEASVCMTAKATMRIP